MCPTLIIVNRSRTKWQKEMCHISFTSIYGENSSNYNLDCISGQSFHTHFLLQWMWACLFQLFCIKRVWCALLSYSPLTVRCGWIYITAEPKKKRKKKNACAGFDWHWMAHAWWNATLTACTQFFLSRIFISLEIETMGIVCNIWVIFRPWTHKVYLLTYLSNILASPCGFRMCTFCQESILAFNSL